MFSILSLDFHLYNVFSQVHSKRTTKNKQGETDNGHVTNLEAESGIVYQVSAFGFEHGKFLSNLPYS